jgi:chloramphenicol 3-O phosphotransferase
VKALGRIVILNGAPRSGKTSIARALQELDTRNWLNIGVDAHIGMLPARLRPGIGLRPGGERPDIEVFIPALYAALFESMCAHSRLGFSVVAEFGIHDDYTDTLGIWDMFARYFGNMKPLLVGVRCSVEENVRRRDAAGGHYAGSLPDGSVPQVVARWEHVVHHGAHYDLELNTDKLTAAECAQSIIRRLD